LAACTVEHDRFVHERLERRRVHRFTFGNINGAAYVSVQARVEKSRWVFESRAFREGEFHRLLVRFACADDAVVLPHGRAHPFPRFEYVRIGFLDELAHACKRFATPVSEVGDSFGNEL
jgi:hypothetical protein